MKLKELLQVIQKTQKQIGAPKVWIVGGIPRDKVLGRLDDISDLDLTTGDDAVDYLSKELSIILGRVYSFDLKKMPDGHASIFLGNLKIDFSSNFNAPNIDSILKNMGIDKPTSMQRELFSRDFTCNTLLMDLDLKTISDPTNLAFNDIKAKLIKTCLAPEITLTSNKNRVIRAIYLAAKLDFNVDDSVISWVSKNPKSVKLASEHTLMEKLNKAMEYDADKTAYLINKMNLWDYIPMTAELHPYYMRMVGRKAS